MNALVTSTATLLLIALTSIIALLLKALGSDAPVSISSYITPLVVLLGVLVAILTFATNIRRTSSADYLRSATELLERAYSTLADLDDKGRPKNNRMNWLGSARFLRASEKISRSITEDPHKVIYREQREYWRARLYDLIQPSDDSFPPDYYAEKPKHMLAHSPGKDRPPLAEASLAVLYRFVRWPQGFDDPIKEEPNFTDQEIDQMQMFGPRGLGSLLADVRKILQQHKGKKP